MNPLQSYVPVATNKCFQSRVVEWRKGMIILTMAVACYTFYEYFYRASVLKIGITFVDRSKFPVSFQSIFDMNRSLLTPSNENFDKDDPFSMNINCRKKGERFIRQQLQLLAMTLIPLCIKRRSGPTRNQYFYVLSALKLCCVIF